MDKYKFTNYRGKKFIDEKLIETNNKIVTRKCVNFILKVSIMFDEIDNITDAPYENKHNRKLYFSTALKKLLQHELYVDLTFGNQIQSEKMILSLKDELYGYIKYRHSEYNKHNKIK